MLVDYEIFCETVINLQAQIRTGLTERRTNLKNLARRLQLKTLDGWIKNETEQKKK